MQSMCSSTIAPIQSQEALLIYKSILHSHWSDCEYIVSGFSSLCPLAAWSLFPPHLTKKLFFLVQAMSLPPHLPCQLPDSWALSSSLHVLVSVLSHYVWGCRGALKAQGPLSKAQLAQMLLSHSSYKASHPHLLIYTIHVCFCRIS